MPSCTTCNSARKPLLSHRDFGIFDYTHLAEPNPTPVEDHNKGRNSGVYSRKLKAGKRRTYFFDVRATKYEDFYITITESKKRFDDGGYERHKLFLYKEDFHKFIQALQDTIDHVKEELLPEYDFDEFNHDSEVLHQDGNHDMENSYQEPEESDEASDWD